MEPWLTVLRLDHAEPLDVEIYDNPVDAETFFHNSRCYGLSSAVQLWFTWHHICKGR